MSTILGYVLVEILGPGVPVARLAVRGRGDAWCYQGDDGRWLPLTPADRRAMKSRGDWPPLATIATTALAAVQAGGVAS